MALWARVGSRFETREDNGISHFLEHMIYRGTRRVPSAHAVNLAFERLGGSLFASTQVDHGIFSLSLPPESLDEASALFGEVLSQPAFLDIDIERGIVLEEILEDLDDEGRQVDADNLSRALIYRDHPLGFTITGERGARPVVRRADAPHAGTSGTTRRTTPCSPSRARSTSTPRDAAGASATSAASPRRRARDGRRRRSTRRRSRGSQIVENVSSQTELRVCLRAFAEKHPLRPALDVLMRLVDDGMSTRLYHRLCDARGLCYDVSAALRRLRGRRRHRRGGRRAAQARRAGDARDPGDVRGAGARGARRTRSSRRRGGASRGTRARMPDSAEETGGVLRVGLLFDRFATPEEHVARAGRGSTADEVREAARQLARPERLNVVAVGLLENGEDERLTDVVKGWAGAA